MCSFFMAGQYSIVYIDTPQPLIHSSVSGHLGYSHGLAIVNSATNALGSTCLLNYGFLRVYAQ